MSTDAPAVSPCEPATVPLREVERELHRQLKCLQGQKTEAPVIRARLSNLIVYCNSEALADEVAAEIPAIVAIHPARVLLLVHDPNGEAEPVLATVHTQMHRVGKGLRAFSELVTIRANGRSGEHLPYAVRSLLIGDLPTNLWWAASQPPAMAGALLYDLSENAEQVIYDSYGWPEPARGMMATASWIEKFERGPGQGRHRVVSDLTWRRLKTWRRVLSQAIDPATAPGALETISEILVDHGPHSVIGAWGMASWLALCLGWKVMGARVQPNLQIDWRFDSPSGPRHMRIRRLADAPKGVREVRICCNLAGFPGVLAIRPEDQDRRLAIIVEGRETAPRTVTVPPQPLPDLLARQLSDRERDPIFRQTMVVAQTLAQTVLGT